MYSKRLKKIVAIFMIVTMVMANVNLDFSSLFQNNKKTDVEVQAKETKEKEPTVVKELEYLRTADSSTYLLSNGSKRLEFYGEDIRYEKDGEFIDYNPTLKKLSTDEKKELKKSIKDSKVLNENTVNDFVYTNTSSDSSLYFPEKIDQNTGIVLEKDNRVISFKPIYKQVEEDDLKVSDGETNILDVVEEVTAEAEEVEVSKNAQNTESSIQEETTKIEETSIKIKENSVKNNLISYIDEVNNVEYKYTSLPTGLKEEIILNERPDTNKFSFDINLEGMKLEILDGSKEVRILDKKTNKLVAYISEPNIKHANSDVTYEEVYYEIEENEDGSYVLNVIVDEEYLSNKSTKYPVTIDPVVFWTNTYLESAAVNDMPYSASYNLKNTDRIQLQNKCRTFGPYVDSQQYCYIDTSDMLSGDAFVGNGENLDSAYIENAYLKLVEFETNQATNPGGIEQFTTGTVEVHPISASWDVDTITWNNHPDMANEILAEFTCTGIHLKSHEIKLTDWVRKVASEETSNFGIALKAKEENTGDTFYSNSMRYLQDENGNYSIPAYMAFYIDYRDVGRHYGIPGVYAPSGNFSEVSNDITVQTILGDISLGITYNSLEYDTDSIVGKGFVFNYAMRVVEKAETVTIIMPSSAHWRFEKRDIDFYSADNRGTLIKQEDKFVLITLDKTSYYFDSNGYLDYIKDRYGNQLNISIDNTGKIQEINDNSGTDVEFKYTEGLLTSVEKKNGESVLACIEYSYNNHGYLIMTKYQNGSEKHYSYENGRLCKITISGENNANSVKSIDITYYADGIYKGMVKSTTNSIGVESVYSYDFTTNSTTINEYTYKTNNSETIANKVRSTKQTYNDKLSIIQVDNLMYSETNQQVEEVQYDNSVADPDCPSSYTDEYGYTTYYTYDGNGNVIKTTYHDESFEESEYNSENLITKHTDRNGLVTNYVYTDDGLLTSTTTGGVLMSTYTYYPESTYGIEGLVHKETDARGNITEYVYNNQGNIVEKIQTIDNVNYTTTYEYNTQGWLIKEVDPNGVTTEYTHDIMGNVILTKVSCQEEGYERFTRTVHDIFGRVIQEIDTLDYKPSLDNLVSDSYSNTEVGVRTQYNTQGQVIKVTDALGNTTDYEYDLDGNVIKEIQANGSYSRYVYDNYGRVAEEYSYDNDRKTEILIKKYTYTEGKNEIVTTEYFDDSDFAKTIEVYNFEGNIEKIIYHNGLEENYEYDNGLLVKEQKGDNIWTTYTYNSWGRVLTEISAFDLTGNSVKKYTYDNYGNVVSELVKNNAFNQDDSYKKTEYTYDSRNNLVATIVYKGKVAVNCTQSYYSWDNKLLREYKGLTEPLVINGLDNIENTLNQEYSVIKYEYDALGRLSKKTDALNKVIEYEYNEENREVKQIDRNGVEHSMTYDRNGNLIKKTSSNNTETIKKTYSYDCMGNMITEKEDNLLIRYVYDAQGNCIKETISDENAESESDADVVKEYTYNNASMMLTHKITIGNTVKQYVSKEYDKMGNIKRVLENNSIKASYTYDLFDRVILTEYNNGVTEENTYNYAGLVTSTTNKKIQILYLNIYIHIIMMAKREVRVKVVGYRHIYMTKRNNYYTK